jgi:PAS domain S-box-containing protein
MRISRKLLLAFLIVGISPVIIAGLFVGSTQRAALDWYSSGRMQQDAGLGVDTIERGLTDGTSHLQATAVALAAAPNDPRAAAKILEQMQRLRPQFRQLAVLKDDGASYARSGAGSIDDQWRASNQEQFAKALHGTAGEVLAGAPVQVGASQAPVIHLAMPFHIAGSTRVLVGELDTQWILDLLKAYTDFLSEEHVAILDTRGRVIFTRNARQAFGATLDPMHAALAAAAAKLPTTNVSPKIPSTDETFYVALLPIAKLPAGLEGWTFISVLSYEKTMAQGREGVTKGVIALLVLLTGAAAVAIWLSRSISKPIQQLTESAAALAAGNYQVRVKRTGGVETTRLADAFNHMADAVSREKQTLEAEVIERRYAERRVDELQRRHKLILNSAADGLLGLDAAGMITFINPAGARLIGEPVESLIGRRGCRYFGCSDTHDRPDQQSTCNHVANCASASDAITHEDDMRRADGEHIAIEYHAAALPTESNQAAGVVVVFRDISLRKAHEDQLQSARLAAEAASLTKSEFLANMSHEIRTPMNGVIGMTELLLETPLNTMQQDYASTVRDSATALLTVINDILDFSKVEAGKLELELLDVNLRDTIEDVARLLAIQAHAKGLEVTAHIDPALPHFVKGDPGRLRQILLNLGGNAVKFTKHGEVAIEVKAVESDPLGTLVRCEVRDTGIGIPSQRLDALFKPFSQVDASTTRRFGGTGLGLSIVKRLVEMMGGETGVTSIEGVGSTFWFTVRLDSSDRTTELRPAMPASLHGQRILIVDDNPTNRKVLMGQLSLCGSSPVCVSSADEALSIMRQAVLANRPFAAALIDFNMPDCDGAKLGEMILSDAQLQSTRLILLTSSGERGDGKRFAQIGFAGYLLKPVTQRDLTETLLLVFSAHAQAWRDQTQPIVTQDALHSARTHSDVRILLAEDNLVNQKVAVRILEKLGYRTDVVNDGRAAVTAWQSGRYDLILMDCQMPELDGYEATREIRELEAGRGRIPIVALTAHAMKGADEECAAAGMDGYLTKPIDRNQLQACLQKFLSADDVKVVIATGTI